MVTVDADDELIGWNVLKVFNAGYHNTKAGVAYSNYIRYTQGDSVQGGHTIPYEKEEKQQNQYRSIRTKYSQLRSFRTEIFKQVKIKDLRDEYNSYFTITYDMAMMFPLMELACGRVEKFPGHHYLYNLDTGMNDHALDLPRQNAHVKYFRSMRRYKCYQPFERRMKAEEAVVK